jgi:hypothetical protein
MATKALVARCSTFLCLALTAATLPEATTEFWGNKDKTLAHVEGVYVLGLTTEKPEADHKDVTMDWIRRVAELRLRRNGIRVLTRDEWLKAPGNPVVSVLPRFLRLEDPKGLYSFSLATSFEQRITLERDPASSIMCSTWEVSTFGTVGGGKLKSSIQDGIEDQIDGFSNVFLTQNPKK